MKNLDVNATQLEKLLTIVLQANKVPMIESSPGLGKSSIVQKIADTFSMELIDYRLSTVDPTDLTGFLVPDVKNGRANYLPPKLFPLEKDNLPDDKKGWLLFLDEITAAPKAIQAAAYKLILDRRVGEHKLHPNVRIVAAGNGVKDNAVAAKMSTALQSRMVHFTLKADLKSWLNWALEAKVDSRVVAYVEHRPEVLTSFDPKHIDKTFACSRTMEFLSDILKEIPQGKPPYDIQYLPLYAGTVGQGVAVEFRGFLEIYKELVKFEDIVLNPETTPLPTEPSAMFAISGVLGERTDLQNIDKVMKYLYRMPIEHQLSAIRKMAVKTPALQSTKEFVGFLDTNAKRLRTD